LQRRTFNLAKRTTPQLENSQTFQKIIPWAKLLDKHKDLSYPKDKKTFSLQKEDEIARFCVIVYSFEEDLFNNAVEIAYIIAKRETVYSPGAQTLSPSFKFDVNTISRFGQRGSPILSNRH